MVGFSEDRKEPLWASYRVSNARRSADYERPPFFYDALRLPESARVGPITFVGYDRGHMDQIQQSILSMDNWRSWRPS